MKCQFGSTPGVGCQDGTFTIKTLLYLINNQNLPTWVEFSYLFKDFDTSNHSLLVDILGKYGATPILCSTIKLMYDNIVVQLLIVKIEMPIDFKVKIKQGERMAPFLFLFLIVAFSKTIEYKGTALCCGSTNGR